MYYLVISTGIIHGVYGSALRAEAELKADSTPFAFVMPWTGLRPSVGQTWDFVSSFMRRD